jgi:isoleucyl-tRNA synthetase
VHLLEWPKVPHANADDAKWTRLRELRTQATEAIEPLRRDKVIGSSLEAEVTLADLPVSAEGLAELFIVSAVHSGQELRVTKTGKHKCGRCWRYLPEVKSDGELCNRCEDVLNG